MVQIRTANISDLPAIMNVEKNGFIPQIQEEESVFEARIKSSPDLFLVFEDTENGAIAGYLSAEYMEKVPSSAEELALGHKPAAVLSSEKKYIYISSFSILPEYRGGGVGKSLWNSSISGFTEKLGVREFLLLVNEQWQGAKHIYEATGFVELARFENFFPTPNEGIKSAGILMQKK